LLLVLYGISYSVSVDFCDISSIFPGDSSLLVSGSGDGTVRQVTALVAFFHAIEFYVAESDETAFFT
jgi:hypothetical protein